MCIEHPPRTPIARRRTRPRLGLTLIELITVIAIIGLLMALLLPAVAASRELARKMSCGNKLRQVGIAMSAYHESNNRLPSGWIGFDPTTGRPSIEGGSGFAWSALLLPYLEQDTVTKNMVDYRLPVLDPYHRSVRSHQLAIYRCPSDDAEPTFTLDSTAGPLELAYASYVGVFGTEEIEECEGLAVGQVCRGNGPFFHNSRVKFAYFLDGQSNTVIVGERGAYRGNSTWVGVIPGGDEAIARILGITDHPPNAEGGHLDDFSSRHKAGSNFLFGDGSVRMITESIDLKIYRGLGTLNGGEPHQSLP